MAGTGHELLVDGGTIVVDVSGMWWSGLFLMDNIDGSSMGRLGSEYRMMSNCVDAMSSLMFNISSVAWYDRRRNVFIFVRGGL